MANKSEILTLLGSRIREIRQQKGVSQRLLSANIDIDERHLRRIEKGEVNTTILLLYDLSEELGITLTDLVAILYDE